MYICSKWLFSSAGVALYEMGIVVFSRKVRRKVPLSARQCISCISLTARQNRAQSTTAEAITGESLPPRLRGLSPLGHSAFWQS